MFSLNIKFVNNAIHYKQSLFSSLVHHTSKKKSARKINQRLTKTGSERCVKLRSLTFHGWEIFRHHMYILSISMSSQQAGDLAKHLSLLWYVYKSRRNVLKWCKSEVPCAKCQKVLLVQAGQCYGDFYRNWESVENLFNHSKRHRSWKWNFRLVDLVDELVLF